MKNFRLFAFATLFAASTLVVASEAAEVVEAAAEVVAPAADVVEVVASEAANEVEVVETPNADSKDDSATEETPKVVASEVANEVNVVETPNADSTNDSTNDSTVAPAAPVAPRTWVAFGKDMMTGAKDTALYLPKKFNAACNSYNPKANPTDNVYLASLKNNAIQLSVGTVVAAVVAYAAYQYANKPATKKAKN